MKTIDRFLIPIRILNETLLDWVKQDKNRILCNYQVEFIPGIQGWFNMLTHQQLKGF